VSEAGNLFATLYLRDPCPIRYAPQLVFVAALALFDALAETARPQAGRLCLKWPNDLLLDGAKLSGILAEARHGGDSAEPIVLLGFGVNVAHAPAGTPYPVTSLRGAGFAADRDGLMAALGDSMASRIKLWRRGEGFAEIRAQWLALAHPPGTPMRVWLAGGEVAGEFAGLDADGRLLLKQPSGTLRVDAGDVTTDHNQPAEKE
jgi:BirA family biotin operon repressor/biotin-[acetyl-CoA-carboxylase] ligase